MMVTPYSIQRSNLEDRPTVEADGDAVPPQSEWIRLDLDDLQCFEVVEAQFQHWGVTFGNAIAIHPSNPSFPTRSGKTVLMAAPKSGFLEMTFDSPVTAVEAFVTGSRRTVLSAYDREGKILASAELSESNLANTESSVPPNAPLKVEADNIDRVTFYAFDGQLTIDDPSFRRPSPTRNI